MMFWRKDGQKLDEGVKKREILPNHDGTFQTSVDLRLSSVSPEEWSRYECVFHLPGVQEDIGLILDRAVIRTNWGKTRSRLNTLCDLQVRVGLFKMCHNLEHDNL